MIFLRNLSAVLFLISLAACSHYQLGKSGKLPFKTIYIQPAKNASYSAQTQAILTEEIASAFQRDGTVRLVSEGEADAILEIIITDYERTVSTTRANDTRLGDSFELLLNASISLANNRGGYYFENRAIKTQYDVLSEGGLQLSEYQATPILAKQLALKIKDTVLSTW